MGTPRVGEGLVGNVLRSSKIYQANASCSEMAHGCSQDDKVHTRLIVVGNRMSGCMGYFMRRSQGFVNVLLENMWIDSPSNTRKWRWTYPIRDIGQPCKSMPKSKYKGIKHLHFGMSSFCRQCPQAMPSGLSSGLPQCAILILEHG